MPDGSVIVLLLLLLVAMPAPLTAQVSMIDIPIEIPLTNLRQRLEHAIPPEKHQQAWVRHGGAELSYRVWRGPLSLWMEQQRLHLSAPIGYWVRARKKVLGPIKIKGSCGLREPPRVALIHVSSRLAWSPAWHLVSETTVHPNRFANPCRMTIANLDVTPIIDRYLRKAMGKRSRERIDTSVPIVTDVRGKVAEIWRKLQSPVELDEDVWLLLQPRSAHTTRFRNERESLVTSLGLTVEPRILIGPQPTVVFSDLPALNVSAATSGHLNLLVRLDLPLDEIRQRLASELLDRTSEFRRTGPMVELLSLATEDSKLIAKFGLGDSSGAVVSLVGRPLLDVQGRRVQLGDVRFAAPEQWPVSQAADHSLPNFIGQAVGEALSWSYAGYEKHTRESLASALNRQMGPSMRLSGKIDTVAPTHLDVHDDAVQVTVRVAGSARVVLD